MSVRELYLMARDISLEEFVGTVSALAFIVEVSVTICIGCNSMCLSVGES